MTAHGVIRSGRGGKGEGRARREGGEEGADMEGKRGAPALHPKLCETKKLESTARGPASGKPRTREKNAKEAGTCRRPPNSLPHTFTLPPPPPPEKRAAHAPSDTITAFHCPLIENPAHTGPQRRQHRGNPSGARDESPLQERLLTTKKYSSIESGRSPRFGRPAKETLPERGPRASPLPRATNQTT